MTTTSCVTQRQDPPLTGYRDYSGKPVAVTSVTATFSAASPPRVDMDAVAIKKDGTAGMASRTVHYDDRAWSRLPAAVQASLTRAARDEAAALAAYLDGAS